MNHQFPFILTFFFVTPFFVQKLIIYHPINTNTSVFTIVSLSGIDCHQLFVPQWHSTGYTSGCVNKHRNNRYEKCSLVLLHIFCTLYYRIDLYLYKFNRPGVAGAVLQTLPLPIKSVGQSSFSSKSSKHHNSKTVKPRELKFWDNVQSPPGVRCQVSGDEPFCWNILLKHFDKKFW